MSNINLIEGTILELCNEGETRKCIIRSIVRNQLVLADIVSGKIEKTTIEIMQNLSTNGKLRILAAEKNHGSLTFTDLSEKEQSEASRKYEYVKELRVNGISKITATSSKSVIARIAEKRGEKAPHWQSVRNWMKNFVAAGHKISGLYPKHKFKGSTAPKIREEVLHIINNESKRYLRASRPSMTSIYRNVEARIIEHNLSNPLTLLEVPSYLTVRQRTLAIQYKNKQKTRKGDKAFEAEMADDHSGIVTSRILERVEIDHTDLDIHVIHDDLLTPLGRPYITALVDHYSHMLLGFQLSFENPSFASVCTACINAFLPKTDTLKSLECDFKWSAHGIPETLVTDNGNEFWGRDFAAVADELGSTFQYCPIRKGRYKSRVERFFGIVNSMLLDDLPGVVRKKGKAAENYNAIQDATITFTDLKKHFLEWIAGVYHNIEVGDTGLTPNELWSSSEELFPVAEERAEDLIPILFATEERIHRKGGIRIFSLQYNSDVLKDVYRRDGPGEVTIKYNKFDIGYILVLDSVNRVYIRVDCDDYQYAKGVSEYEHKQITARVRQSKKTKIECVDLQRAKVSLAKQRDEFHARNGRRKNKVTGAKAARIEKVGVPELSIVPKDFDKAIPLSLDDEVDDLDLDGWAVD